MNTKKIIVSLVVLFCCTPCLYAEVVWKNIGSEINAREFNCVTVDLLDPQIVYVGTSNGAYRTLDRGLKWEQVFKEWGERGYVRHIYIAGEKLYLCTDGGLFISKDNGKSWDSSFGIASKVQVFSVAMLKEGVPTIFIVTSDGLFKSTGSHKRWNKVYSMKIIEDTYIEDGNDNTLDTAPKARAVLVSQNYPSRIYIGTEDGILVSDDADRPFKRFMDEGLLNKDIVSVTESPFVPGRLYVVTKKGVFYYSEGWHAFEETDSLRDTRSIAFALDPKNSIWIATKRGIYKTVDVATGGERVEVESENLLNLFSLEPTIAEVQAWAINYGEVHPEKIADWRKRANASALLPRLSLGIDRSESDTYEIYTSSTKQYAVEGPKKGSDGWDITLSWDLGELIWNGDQTLIDVRSKLMAQLRDDILDEVTSYYFERRRLQIELLEVPPKNKAERVKKELRVQELTANIDALTGGSFSHKL